MSSPKLLRSMSLLLGASLAAGAWFARPGYASRLESHGATLESSFENTNLFGYSEGTDWQDMNRLRYEGLLSWDKLPKLDADLQVDAKTSWELFDEGFQAKASIYRAYVRYQGDKTLVVAGKQRIPFGVGRIWNPIDVFNPIDSTAIEPDEREGTDALHGEYSLSALAIADATVASEKAAVRLKGYLDFADCALVGEVDNTTDLVISGWELEGELFGSGIEARSEGGIFYDRQAKETSLNFIIGTEYAFANSLDLTLEYLYSGIVGHHDIGLATGYQLNMLTYLSCLVIVNLRDESSFLAPSVEYSLSDEMTLTGGLSLYQGGAYTEFGQGDDLIWLKWFVHF